MVDGVPPALPLPRHPSRVPGCHLRRSARSAGMNILVCTPGRLLQHMDETPGFDASQLQASGGCWALVPAGEGRWRPRQGRQAARRRSRAAFRCMLLHSA